MLTDAPSPDGLPFILTTLRNTGGMTVTLMGCRATWLSAVMPLKSGEKWALSY